MNRTASGELNRASALIENAAKLVGQTCISIKEAIPICGEHVPEAYISLSIAVSRMAGAMDQIKEAHQYLVDRAEGLEK